VPHPAPLLPNWPPVREHARFLFQGTIIIMMIMHMRQLMSLTQSSNIIARTHAHARRVDA